MIKSKGHKGISIKGDIQDVSIETLAIITAVVCEAARGFGKETSDSVLVVIERYIDDLKRVPEARLKEGYWSVWDWIVDHKGLFGYSEVELDG